MGVGSRKLEVGSWKLEVGSRKSEDPSRLNLVNEVLPLVPETFLAGFPVSVKSL